MNGLIPSLILTIAALGSLAGSSNSSATSGPLDITKSSVADDLEAFYGEKYGDKIIQNLVPNTARGDSYSDFKFFHFYPWQGDLYFYFYAATAFNVDTVQLEYSDGATFDSEGVAVENWHLNGEENTPAVTIEDTFGDRRVFYKCKIADFYTHQTGDKHRVYAKSVTCSTTRDSSLVLKRACQEAELAWEDVDDGEDLVYKYYKDDYIVIDEAAYYQQWIATRYNGADQRYPTEINEINWLFFTWSGTSIDGKYELGALKEVVLDYEYLSYDATYEIKMDLWGADAMMPVYTGTYDHPEIFTKALTGASCSSVRMSDETTTLRQTTIVPQIRTIDTISDTAEWWQIWLNSHRVTYSYNTIQALDQESVQGIGDEDTRSFFLDFVGDYKYAVMMRQDTRSILNSHEYDNFGMHSAVVTSRAHEIRSARMTRLTFNSEFGDVSLNAMMHEVKLTGIFATPGTIVEIENKTTSAVKNAIKWILIALGSILGLTLLGYCAVGLIRYAKKR